MVEPRAWTSLELKQQLEVVAYSNGMFGKGSRCPNTTDFFRQMRINAITNTYTLIIRNPSADFTKPLVSLTFTNAH